MRAFVTTYGRALRACEQNHFKSLHSLGS